jgi:CRISPR/Cas system endoribonuclease Cas6 (RAMP superfamily)
MVKKGQLRHLLFASPDLHLAKSVFSHIEENLIENGVISIGEQQYRIKSSELFETRVTGGSCIIRTSTPVTIRIPEKSYDAHDINKKDRKSKFLYWRSNLSHDIFLNMVLSNLKAKYKHFYKTDSCSIESAVHMLILLKEIVIHIPLKGVKGRGIVMTKEDPSRTVTRGDKISMKYLGTLDHPVAKVITDGAKKGEVVLIEISPKFFSTWDYSKV